MSVLDDRDRHLRQMLAQLQADYRAQAKPIIDELCAIEALRPPPPPFLILAALDQVPTGAAAAALLS